MCTLKGTCQYNTNDQSMYVLKGLKEALIALTVLIVAHVTEVKRVESGVTFMQHCIQRTVMLLNLLLMSKGLKVSNTL